MSDKSTPRTDARWLQVQSISTYIAHKDEAPSEAESALCFAVYRSNELERSIQASEQRRVEDIRKCHDEIPTNWCDPLLTGPDAVIKESPCPEIEKLLKGVQARIRAAFPEAFPKETS